jgi:hypothetical protein
LSDTELSPLEHQEQLFLANPDAPALLAFHAFLMEELLDDHLARVLETIRPIQHRVTLIQADASGPLLEALCRDPHRDVRKVVASHAGITEEVSFRLCEDPEYVVRLALRKNPACHPVIHAALLLREKRGDEHRIKADHLLEVAWQARRCKFDRNAIEALFRDWIDLEPEDYYRLEITQANRLLEVLDGHLGNGPMPRKPRKKASSKKKAASKSVSKRSKKAKRK